MPLSSPHPAAQRFARALALLLAAGCAPGGSGNATDVSSGDPAATDAEVWTPSFFVTSEGLPNGGNLGGLAGADARCAELATVAGLPEADWRAYLSATGPIHARDRIGDGPWWSVDGTLVATDVDSLVLGIPDAAMLDEFGNLAQKSEPPGVEHDMLTGSTTDGLLVPSEATCADWTSSRAEDRARVGHHDWERLPSIAQTQNWQSVHGTPCDPEGMLALFGTARTYCFATDAE